VFFQLNRELFIEGKPFLDANTNDFVALICNNFVDKEGTKLVLQLLKRFYALLNTIKDLKRINE
jgi:hypothetical protein